MGNAEILDTTAHLMAGPIARGERELTAKELEHLSAANAYICLMLGSHHVRRAAMDAVSVWDRWREMGGKSE